MKNELVRIRYDGPALKDNLIDVNHLAPALLALGDLCTLANKRFNGDRASVKVLVRADFEAKCFDVGIEFAQTILERARTFIKDDEVKTAKEILEWLGIVGGSGWGFFGLVKWCTGKTISKKEFIKEGDRELVKITEEGGAETKAFPEAVILYEETESLAKVQQIVSPLTEDGYDSLKFQHEDKVTHEFSKEDAVSITAPPLEVVEDDEQEEPPDTVTAWIKVYSPVYDPNAKNWRFEYGGNTVYMDISETNIAEETIRMGASFVGDLYQVSLQITQTISLKTGNSKNHYKILKVKNFRPSNLRRQRGLFDEPEGSSEEK